MFFLHFFYHTSGARGPVYCDRLFLWVLRDVRLWSEVRICAIQLGEGIEEKNALSLSSADISEADHFCFEASSSERRQRRRVLRAPLGESGGGGDAQDELGLAFHYLRKFPPLNYWLPKSACGVVY